MHRRSEIADKVLVEFDQRKAARVVVASGRGDHACVLADPRLFAVVAASAEEAEAVVQAVVPGDVVIAAVSAPLTPKTVDALDLQAGEVKQIG